MRKSQLQTGREHELVLFLSRGRIGDIGVAKIVLPPQPFYDLSSGAKIEVDPVVPAVDQIGEICGGLVQGGVFPYSSHA